MDIRAIRTEGLGDSTYVLIDEGVAVIVDPQRDVDRFETILDETGAELRFVLETHLHNDYLSGGRDLARRLEGELVLPSGAAPVFRHRPAFHHEDLDGGPLAIRPIHTPGHTPEHMSYLVSLDGKPMAVFSGGSLLVGSAGRTDLLGEDRADTLARLQYISVHRLATLPDDVGLYPTHGGGSFCTTSVAGKHMSSIGDEKKANPVLAHPDEDSFVNDQLSGLVPYPSYYRYMSPANLAGVEPPGPFGAPPVSEGDYQRLGSDVAVVDARPETDFASGHLAGSIGIGLRDNFGVWAGWVLPFNSPLVLVMNPGQDVEEAIRQLARIGFDDVRGIITDLGDWQSELVSYPTVTVAEFAEAVREGAQVVDTRAPNEWESGTIPGSISRYVPDLAASVTDGLDPDNPVWVACGSGYRASIAASYLESDGFEPAVLLNGGVTEVLWTLSKQRAASEEPR